jgi:hypothetical protein
VPDDRLAAATAELYGAAPEAFTERRSELAAAARDAGDRAAAKAIGALRRPTRAAWVVNRLAHADPGAPPKLAELAAALRAAQEARNGPRLRELSAARGALVDALTAQALAAADVPDPAPSLQFEVSQTLTAALADPEVAAAFAAGTLTRAVQWSGFGVLPADAGPDEETGAGETPQAAKRQEAAKRDGSGAGVAGRADASAPGTAGPDTSRARAGAGSERPGAGARRGAGAPAGEPTKAAGTKRGTRASETPADAGAAARRQAEAEERLAREVAERAAWLREQYEEAERVVSAASAAAAQAVSAEDQLEADVRDLEQRLTQARADLAAARMRARHAEAAERRARQALGRLPHPLPTMARKGQISARTRMRAPRTSGQVNRQRRL